MEKREGCGQRGIAATALAIGGLILLTVATIATSIILQKSRQTQKSRAEGNEEMCGLIGGYCTDEQECLRDGGVIYENYSCGTEGTKCCVKGTPNPTAPPQQGGDQSSQPPQQPPQGGQQGVEDTSPPNQPKNLKAELAKVNGKDVIKFSWRWNGDNPKNNGVGYCKAYRDENGNIIKYASSRYENLDCKPNKDLASPFWWQIVAEKPDKNNIKIFKCYNNRIQKYNPKTGEYVQGGYGCGYATRFDVPLSLLEEVGNVSRVRIDLRARDAFGNITDIKNPAKKYYVFAQNQTSPFPTPTPYIQLILFKGRDIVCREDPEAAENYQITFNFKLRGRLPESYEGKTLKLFYKSGPVDNNGNITSNIWIPVEGGQVVLTQNLLNSLNSGELVDLNKRFSISVPKIEPQDDQANPYDLAYAFKAEIKDGNNILASDEIDNPKGVREIVSNICQATPTPTPPQAVRCETFGQGDANCDGRMNGIDYTIWLKNQCRINCPSVNLQKADFNSDGKVDDSDYGVWAENSE